MQIKNKLYFLRNQINNLDYKIIKILKKRESASVEILKYKLSKQLCIRDKNREIELFQSLNRRSKKNKINPEFIKKLFQIIVHNSILIQKNWKKKILTNQKKYFCGYLGPIGSYSHAAFSSLSKKNKNILLASEHSNFTSIIESLVSNRCKFALLPIENRISGIISEVYDIIKQKKEIYIIKEIYIKINHHLLTTQNCFINDIQRIYSHEQPFKQCSTFLNKFPEWKKCYFPSTAAAIKQMVIENNKTTAVLGSADGKDFYNLKSIAKNLSNKKNNITRFILISKKLKKIPENIESKTTIFITLNDNITNKKKILNIFKKRNIKVIKMISPKNIIKKIQKTYFLEIQSHIDSEITKDALHHVAKYAINTRILGCYPAESMEF
ncbi:prephenate dehydratase domain-containing protein [Buchnera aphidicola]|uniref:prephenate dehydratase domain-containing protein n=1 Tax=Buchnera aphidicola TaxID=9 RepID=UPI00094CB974|nr:prephenate dehydratase domain-containing protein [Buchnera aphidicola]